MNNLKVQKPGNFEKSNQLLSTIIPTPFKMNNTVGTPGYKRPLITVAKGNHSYNTPNCYKKIDYNKFANILDNTVDLSSSTILENPLEPPVKRFKETSFSPIVRKCLEQLDNKLENIISRQLDTILKKQKIQRTPRKTSTPESNEKSQFSNLMHTVEVKVHQLVTENLNRYHENYRKLAHTDKLTPQHLTRETLRRSARLSKAFKENIENYGPRRTLFSKSIESEQTNKKLRLSIRLSNSSNVEFITETPRDQPNSKRKTPQSDAELQPEIHQSSDQKETNPLSNFTRETLRRSARLSKAFKENTENYGPRRTLFSESIESEQTNKKLRSSIRLSNSSDLEFITETPRDQSNSQRKTPQSDVELQPEIHQSSDQKETNPLSNLVALPSDYEVFKIPQQSPPKAIKPRRSMRISNIFQTRLSILPPETPKPKVVGKGKENLPVETAPRVVSKRKIKAATKLISDSPSAYENPIRKRRIKNIKFLNHHERVLDILNNGSSTELMSLVTVGTKTAKQIILSRSFHGKIESFDELRELPFWSTKQCDKFIKANYLEDS